MTTPSNDQSPPEGPHRIEVVVTSGVIIVAAALLYAASRLPVVNRGRLSAGPGPGVFPIVAAALLLALATWHLISVLRRGAWATPTPINSIVGWVVVVFVAAITLLRPIGFFFDMTLMVATLMTLFGERKLWLVALTSPVAAFASLLIFGEVFSVRLPTLGIPIGPWTL